LLALATIVTSLESLMVQSQDVKHLPTVCSVWVVFAGLLFIRMPSTLPNITTFKHFSMSACLNAWRSSEQANRGRHPQLFASDQRNYLDAEINSILAFGWE
jgi:hypothetical protein